MNSMNRRGALRLIGGAPFVAKKAISKLTGASVLEGDINASVFPASGQSTGGSSLLRGKLLAGFLKKIGLPDFKKRELRRYARSSRLLDPDIASLRSVSLSAKLNMQWQRNERNQEEKFFEYMIDADEADCFRDKHNTSYF